MIPKLSKILGDARPRPVSISSQVSLTFVPKAKAAPVAIVANSVI